MAVATPDDVAERIGRPLNPDEELQVSALLEDAEAEIRRWRGGAKIADPTWRPQILKVECSMILRAARIPNQVTEIVPSQELVSYDFSQVSRGEILLRRSDRRSLGMRLNGSVNLYPVPECDL